MSDGVAVREWLESRVPTPPAALSELFASTVGESRCSMEDLPVFLFERAKALMAKLGSGRESANDLLAADALITYGLEAASENNGNIKEIARHAMTSISAVASRHGKPA